MAEMSQMRETEPGVPAREQVPTHGVFVDQADLDEVSGGGGQTGGVVDWIGTYE